MQEGSPRSCRMRKAQWLSNRPVVLRRCADDQHASARARASESGQWGWMSMRMLCSYMHGSQSAVGMFGLPSQLCPANFASYIPLHMSVRTLPMPRAASQSEYTTAQGSRLATSML